MRTLDKEDLEDISIGATIFGAGGGGSYHSGLELIKKIDGTVELLSVEEMPKGAKAAAVAGIGSPKVMLEKGFGPEAVNAFREIKKLDDTVSYVMAGEMGGFNTITPIYVASEEKIPILDADGNGRAVPELNTGLYPIYNIPANPLVITDKEENVVIGKLKSTKMAEGVARGASVAFGMVAAFSTWIVDAHTIKSFLVSGSISLAKRAGEIIREYSEKERIKKLEELTKGREIFHGRIERIEDVTKGGFDSGKTTIKGDGTFEICFVNENMIAFKDGKPMIMVPDIIAMIREDGQPLTNADTKEGDRISVLGIPAPEPWMRTAQGFECWKEILERLGYTGEYKRGW